MLKAKAQLTTRLVWFGVCAGTVVLFVRKPAKTSHAMLRQKHLYTAAELFRRGYYDLQVNAPWVVGTMDSHEFQQLFDIDLSQYASASGQIEDVYELQLTAQFDASGCPLLRGARMEVECLSTQ